VRRPAQTFVDVQRGKQLVGQEGGIPHCVIVHALPSESIELA
jgi:hypothetical protein